MDAGVAQLVEQVIRNDQVAGSNPVTGFVRQEDANLHPTRNTRYILLFNRRLFANFAIFFFYNTYTISFLECCFRVILKNLQTVLFLVQSFDI